MIDPLCTNEVAVNHRPQGGIVAPVRCKRWSCPNCHQRNRRLVIAKCINGQPRAMLTLTVSSKQYPDPTQAALALKNGLRALRKAIDRHPRFNQFQFLAVFEKHKSGAPHLHLLIRSDYLPQKWLKRQWRSATGSTHVDIRKIPNDQKAAFYVAKYMGKDLSAFEGCKRWWRSKGYELPEDESEALDIDSPKWVRFVANVEALAQLMEQEGFHVGRRTDGSLRYSVPDGCPYSPMDIHFRHESFKTWTHLDDIKAVYRPEPPS